MNFSFIKEVIYYVCAVCGYKTTEKITECPECKRYLNKKAYQYKRKPGDKPIITRWEKLLNVLRGEKNV